MARTTVILRDTAPTRSAPTDTGRACVVCIPERGTFDPQVSFRSHQAAEDEHGERVSYSVWWDWAELFFREGGSELYVIPVRGPAPVAATANLAGTAGTALVVTANSVGEWGNGATGGLSVQVVNGPSGATHREIIIFVDSVEVERTPEFDDWLDAIAWSEGSDYVTITLGGGTASLPVVAAEANLASGTLDRASISQTEIDAAIASLSADLGPMQIAAPDWQTEATHESLLTHCAERERFALCDPTDTTAKATLLTAGNAVQGHADSAYGAMVAPWITIAGTAGGSARAVPASAFVAAKCAQVDRDAGSGQAPAGQYGLATSSLVTGLEATFSDEDQTDLEDAGVNLVISRYGGVLFDGNRTLVEPTGADAEWKQIGVSRLRMQVVSALRSDGELFEHIALTQINIARFDAALTGRMLLLSDQFYPADDESDPGFVVDTSTGVGGVNTPTTIEAEQLIAAVGFRPAPGADMVTIYLTAVGIAGSLA